MGCSIRSTRRDPEGGGSGACAVVCAATTTLRDYPAHEETAAIGAVGEGGVSWMMDDAAHRASRAPPSAVESEYVYSPQVATTSGAGDRYFGIERSVLVVGRVRMSCVDDRAHVPCRNAK